MEVVQVYDALEVFAGIGSLTKCLRAAGLVTGMIEIKYWQAWQEERALIGLPIARGNPLDMLSPAGFACLASRKNGCKHAGVTHYPPKPMLQS